VLIMVCGWRLPRRLRAVILPMLSGVDVVREVRAYAPGTVVAAQVAYDEDVAEMLDAGARAVYTRRVPPAEVALGLWGLPAA